MPCYLRTKTEVRGALHLSAIWDLHYQNCLFRFVVGPRCNRTNITKMTTAPFFISSLFENIIFDVFIPEFHKEFACTTRLAITLTDNMSMIIE